MLTQSPTTTAVGVEPKSIEACAATLASQGLSSLDILERLRTQFPSIGYYTLRTCARLASVLEESAQDTADAHTAATETRTERCNQSSPPVGPITSPADPRLREYRFGAHALLPAETLGSTALVPVALAQRVFLFAPSPRPQHTVELPKLGIRMIVGDGDEHGALTTKHMVFMTAIYGEAQACGMIHVELSAKPYLKIKTTLKRLHRLMRGTSAHGGRGHKVIKQWLDELRDTPVVTRSLEGNQKSGSDHRFVAHWEMHGRKVVIYLSPFWSEAFGDRTKGKIKPIDFAQLRNLPGAMNKLTYVHIDYASSHNGRTELRTCTLLERTGALDESRRSGPSLLGSLSRRLQRLDKLWMLDGLPLSNGRVLRLNLDEARCDKNRDKRDLKLVVETDPKSDRSQQKGTPIADVQFFQQQKARWEARRQRA